MTSFLCDSAIKFDAIDAYEAKDNFCLLHFASPIKVNAALNQLLAAHFSKHWQRICDELETKLTQSVTESKKLMDAVVRQLLTA